MIIGYVNGQDLRVQNPKIVEKTINYITAKFVFLGSEWSECDEIWAHFRKGNEVYDLLLDADNEVKSGRNLNLSAGEWDVYLHGNVNDGGDVKQRITTDDVKISVIQIGSLSGDVFPDVPASALEQVIAKIDEVRDAADEAQKTADDVGAFADRIDEKLDAEIEYTSVEITDLRRDVDIASAKATSAVSVANIAIDNANQAITDANDASQKADDASTEAAEATAQASAAAAQAASAASDASAALTAATNANAKADTAISTANGKYTKPSGGIPAYDIALGVIPTVPDRLPNPQKLTFTGAASGEYDGSYAVTVNIPQGGGGGGISDVTLNNRSIVADGVAAFSAGAGLKVDGTAIRIENASDAQLSNRTGFRAVTGANLDFAIKAALCDGKGSEWDEESKRSAQERIGILSVEEVLF